MTINELQKQVVDNKIAHGFRHTPDHDNVQEYFCLLYGEVAEAYEAWRKKKDDLPLELADIVIYTMGLFDQLGFNACDEIKKKLEINRKRIYYTDERGVRHKKEG